MSTASSSSVTGLLDFLRSAEKLKNTLRNSRTSEGRTESVAEHTWRLCLMALVFEHTFPEIDLARLFKICIIHDLGEAIGGDIPAPEQVGAENKAAQEQRDLMTLLAPLPAAQRREIAALWKEYETAATPEARLAKAFDKLETILQHNQGQNPADFDYTFNLGYGQQYTSDDPRIVAIRRILDAETRHRAES